MSRAIWCPECGKVVPILTERELQVLRLIAQGKSSAQIARWLGLAISTVRNYTLTIYRAIGVTNRTEAALYAVSHGIVTPRKAHRHTRS